ncbi:MAG: hypothetical protein R2715_14345 [Ilumatobacteraceae bacterium]
MALVGLTADPARAIAGAVAALGIGTTVAAGSEVEALVAAVEALAPAQVCIVADGLDDDHAPVDEESAAAAADVLRTLLRDLPASGHLLVVSRRPIDLARRASNCRARCGGSTETSWLSTPTSKQRRWQRPLARS